MADEKKNLDAFDLLEAASAFLTDPSDKEAKARLDDLKSKIIVRTFLPLEQKEQAALKTLYDINAADTHSHHFASALEISFTFNALFAYIVNVDYNVADFLKDSVFYDLFWMAGLGDYILQYCEKDYMRLKSMVTAMISFENIKALLTEIGDMDPGSINRLTESFNHFVVDTNPDVLKAMAEIVRGGNPLYTRVADTIEANAVKAAMQKQERKEKEDKAEDGNESGQENKQENEQEEK